MDWVASWWGWYGCSSPFSKGLHGWVDVQVIQEAGPIILDKNLDCTTECKNFQIKEKCLLFVSCKKCLKKNENKT